MKKALVTGATGMIGYNIVKVLLDRGREVKSLVRSIEKGKRILPHQCELIKGDVTDKASLINPLDGCDVVYHCAGFPEQWMKDSSTFDRMNVSGTRNITEAALEKKVDKFVYTSTIDVFKAAKGEAFDESVIDDKAKGTYYERSKQEADRIVASALDKGLPAVFLHPGGLYGPGPSDSPGFNDFLVDLKNGNIPILLPGGFSLAFSQDVAEGHVLAEEKAAVGERFILSDQYYDLTEIAAKVLTALNMKPKIPSVMPITIARMISTIGEFIAGLINKPPLIPKGQLHFFQWQARPDSSKAKAKLGWKPHAFDQGLQMTIDYLKKENRI